MIDTLIGFTGNKMENFALFVQYSVDKHTKSVDKHKKVPISGPQGQK